MLQRTFILIAALIVASPQCHALYTLTDIGDSLVDSGSMYQINPALFAETPLDPSDPNYDPRFPVPRFPTPPFYEGRISNGPIWTEYLAELLGVTAPTPWINGGTSASQLGATTFQRPTPFDSLDMQSQLDNLLSTHTPDPMDINIIWGGANDILLAPDTTRTVGNLKTIIEEFYGANGRRFLIPNLPLLGKTPFGAAIAPDGLNALTLAHNQALASALDDLEARLSGIEIIRLDIAGLFEDILANPADYDITNTTDTALAVVEDPTSPLFFFPEYPISIAPNVNEYLFYEGLHPTTRIHAFIADAAYAAIVPEPNSILLCIGLLGCLVVGRLIIGRNPVKG